MRILDMDWIEGDVGDWWLRVGFNDKVVHVYTNPWSPLWIADAPAFGIEQFTFANVDEAKIVAEVTFRDWLEDSLHIPEADDDDIIIDDGLPFI